ncbi:amidohydrolase family protein [Reyranella sp.]|uniref:amidohydrolase family protein n=1 Tax=Reyranella sp. TaxID=1929291 RepID=UPI003BAD7FA9
MTLPLIDVHTHMYLPRYMALLRQRTKVPRVVSRAGGDRLVILPDEEADTSTSAGRPIGGEFHEVSRKLAFMDQHGIAVSVVSPANPWIDFVEPEEAPALAAQLNDDLEAICAGSAGRLLGFGVLPLQRPETCAAELRRIAGHPHMRGVIVGSAGRGKGLDDPDFEPIWKAAADAGLFVFIHPHYGVGHGLFPDTGHAMMLALGFTFETSIAVALLILRGTLQRHPALKLLIAHAGGTLPYLAGRLDSCVKNDISKDFGLAQPPSHYLRQCWFDSISYHPPALAALEAFADPSRIMFGTDHPFFRPHVGDAVLDRTTWPVPEENLQALASLSPARQKAIAYENGLAAFGIALP